MWPSFTVAGWVFVPIIGLGCVVCGYYALVKWIPSNAKKDEARTDFYSARASYHMIGVGLLILLMWTIAAVIIRTLAIAKILGLIK
jgi:hypothetical protein